MHTGSHTRAHTAKNEEHVFRISSLQLRNTWHFLTFCTFGIKMWSVLEQPYESFCQHDFKNWCAPVLLCESPDGPVIGWAVVLSNVWLVWCFYLSGSESLRVYFYHDLLQASGCMAEDLHHLCPRWVHIHAPACFSHEVWYIGHFVDLTLFLLREAASLCVITAPPLREILEQVYYFLWTVFPSVLWVYANTNTAILSSSDADSSWLTQVDL